MIWPIPLKLWNFLRGCRLLNRLGYYPWQRLTVFDVGANDGSSFAWLPEAFSWMHVYAFEPTPELVEQIRQRLGNRANYHLIPKAVGENPGVAKFNVAGNADWGCSSLLEFSDNLEKTWPGRTDFSVTKRIDVEIIRLDDFVKKSNIKRIDFLHVDTQGTDLSVLRSLGDEIKIVQAGVVEVPQSTEVKLYRNQHTREEAVEFLNRNGFTIWKTVHQQNEDNLYFRRK